MKRRTLVVPLLLVLSMSVTLIAEQPSPEANQELSEALEVWVTAYNKHDAQAVAREYAEDCDLMTLDGKRLRGRAAIEKDYAEIFSKNPNVKSKFSEVTRRLLAPGVVIEDGVWEESGHSEPGLPKKGHYSSVLAKIQGRWQVVHERSWVLKSS